MPDEKSTSGWAVRLTVTITDPKGKHTHYLLRFLPSHPQVGSPAWRMTKLEDGRPSETVYDVIMTRHGATCDCPDSTYRGSKKLCKHCRCLIAAGLMREMELIEEESRSNEGF